MSDNPEHRSFRRRGRVTAHRLTEPVEWQTTNGDVLRGAAGDWWVEGPNGVGRSVTDTEFRGSYEPAEDGQFRRVGTVTARRALVEEGVQTLEGPALALPGMWVVTGPNGNSWPVPDDAFREGYEEI